MAETTNVASRRQTAGEELERSAVDIRQDIAARRDSISETVDKLGERLQETVDWRKYIGEYPAVTLGLAAAAGFLVAGIFKREPTPKERIMDAVADLTEDMTNRVGSVMSGVIQKNLVSGRTIKAAATAMITKSLVDIVKKQITNAMAADSRLVKGSELQRSELQRP